MVGTLLTFEGGEGAGKTTVIAAVLAALDRAGIAHVATREPGGTPFGEAIRATVLGAADVAPEAELLAMFAARAQHMRDVIRPALDAGKWVVCDRFVDSSYAYQGGGRRIPTATIEALERLFVGLEPDLTFYLDVPPETGLARVRSRGGPLDRIEKEQLAFFEDVRFAYLRRAAEAPERVRVVDATHSPDSVAGKVVEGLQDALRRAQSATGEEFPDGR